MKITSLLWLSALSLMSAYTAVMADTAASVVTVEGAYIRAVPPG